MKKAELIEENFWLVFIAGSLFGGLAGSLYASTVFALFWMFG